MSYFFIYNDDGDTHVQEIRPGEMDDFLAQLANRELDVKLLPNLTDSNTNYWGGGILIKGEIVVPRPVQVVTKFEVD